MWIATPSLRRTCTDYSLRVSRRTTKDPVRHRINAAGARVVRKILPAPAAHTLISQEISRRLAEIGACAVSDGRDERLASIDLCQQRQSKHHPQKFEAAHPQAFKEIIEDNKESK